MYTGDSAVDKAHSIAQLAGKVPCKAIPALLQKVNDMGYKKNKTLYHSEVFPFFHQIASTAALYRPGDALRKLCPNLTRLHRSITTLSKHHSGIMYEHIKIGSSLTPSALLLWIPTTSWINCVVAVRATANSKDIVTDLKGWHSDLALMNANGMLQLYGNKGHPHPRVHAGFHDYHIKLYAALMPRILHTMSLFEGATMQSFRFFFTGHSLGGLSAIMALAMSDALRTPVFAFSFGAPRIGNAAFNQLFVHPAVSLKRYFRIFNRDDVIPKLRGVYPLQHVDAYIKSLKHKPSHLSDHHAIDMQDYLEQALGPAFYTLPKQQKYTILHCAYSFDGRSVWA